MKERLALENKKWTEGEVLALMDRITALELQCTTLAERMEHIVAGMGFLDTDVTEMKKRLAQTWSPGN